jgi:hypothetical protein
MFIYKTRQKIKTTPAAAAVAAFQKKENKQDKHGNPSMLNSFPSLSPPLKKKHQNRSHGVFRPAPPINQTPPLLFLSSFQSRFFFSWLTQAESHSIMQIASADTLNTHRQETD